MTKTQLYVWAMALLLTGMAILVFSTNGVQATLGWILTAVGVGAIVVITEYEAPPSEYREDSREDEDTHDH